jgi:hypothetical protein
MAALLMVVVANDRGRQHRSTFMKLPALVLFFLALATGMRAVTPVEAFCSQFSEGAEVRVYRGFPELGYDKKLYDDAQKAGCLSLLGQMFYPDITTLDQKETAEWLRQATDASTYYAAGDTEQKFHADIGFWCVSKDHKNEAYCLVSLPASQARFWVAGKEATVSITIDFENLCREVLRHTAEAK